MTNGNDSAFSRPASVDETDGTLPDGNRQVSETEGLTKREHFAAMAMQGLTANIGCGDQERRNPATFAKYAVDFADALIEALNK